MKAKFLIKTLVTTLIFSGILFLSAGKIGNGWIFLATNIITAFMNFFYIRNNEALMNERTKPGDNAKAWDKKILGISALVYVANIIIAGLDAGRFGWSPAFPWVAYACGVLVTIIGQIIFLEARKQNAFFSSVVRIQTDRGHHVCDTGLYAIVRHPGYLGMTISLLGVPLITGSIWCSITTGIAIILLIVRTQLEDKTLKNELPGYQPYTEKTKCKLVPLVW